MSKFDFWTGWVGRALMGAVLAVLLAACGGGSGGGSSLYSGGSSGGTGGTTKTGTATLAVSISTTAITAAAPGTVKAVLTSSTGSPMAGVLVTFTTSKGLGVFSAGTALTDSTGTATVTVAPASSASNGADYAIATASVGSGSTATSVTGQVGFTTTATALPASSFTLSLSTQTITAASPATLSATLTSASGSPVSGQVVTFATTAGLGTFSASSALTNSAGVATTTMYPTNSTSAGADTVTASVTASGTVLTASAGYQVNATQVTISSFTSDLASGASLAAYGQSNLALALAGTVTTTPVKISITSQCASLSTPKATITPSSLSTTTGQATFTYVDQGCGALQATDIVTVTAGSVTQQLTIPLTSPAVATMTFVSATPSTLFLSTSGVSPQSSVVTFQLSDQNGTGVPGKSVTLQPTTTIGGLTMDAGSGPETKVTNSLGQVSVQINSGTVPTPVRVVATYTPTSGAAISSSSSNLSIAVGLPTQSRFSLAQGSANIEAYSRDGTSNSYTVYVADRLGNPVPSSTIFNFVNTMGQVLTQVPTGSSTSISQVTANSASGGSRPYHWDGRVTTMAYAIGEMSFTDVNGNNTYDSGEDYQDLGDPYLDPKFRGYYDSSLQTFPFGGSASCHVPTSINYYLYDELLGAAPTSGSAYVSPLVPAEPNTCRGSWGKAFVRAAAQTVWSTSENEVTWGASLPDPSLVGTAYAPSGTSCPATRTLISTYQPTTAGAPNYVTVRDVDGTQLYNVVGSTISFLVSDANQYAYNPMAAGTTVTVSSSPSAALATSIVGGGTLPSTLTPTRVTATFAFNSGYSSGALVFTFTSPSGLQTTATVGLTTAPTLPSGATNCP
ncbi:MAG: hypothetical protein JO218_16215 [Burkholderiales bacterium]|nr:hypothetical protein [Roseateles sp.]MBV8467485.1 hypothetical protein [Burkholderiales bacterium]